MSATTSPALPEILSRHVLLVLPWGGSLGADTGRPQFEWVCACGADEYGLPSRAAAREGAFRHLVTVAPEVLQTRTRRAEGPAPRVWHAGSEEPADAATLTVSDDDGDTWSRGEDGLWSVAPGEPSYPWPIVAAKWGPLRERPRPARPNPIPVPRVR